MNLNKEVATIVIGVASSNPCEGETTPLFFFFFVPTQKL